MRAAIQHPSLLIGTEEAIEKLAQKDNATVLVAADSHGAINTLERILREKGRQCDAFIFCGDGMSDLCRCLEKQIVDKHFCACIPPVVAVVEGNNDSDLHPMINPEIEKNPEVPYYVEIKVPLSQKLVICGHVFFITHGHRYSLYNGTEGMANAAIEAGAEIVVYGHTHIALAGRSQTIQIFNPGSCARPRGGQPPSFAVLKVKKDSPKFDYTFFRLLPRKSEPFIPLVPPLW